jgi:RNA polymerase primary sigma factor/RNA polymerase sigma factor
MHADYRNPILRQLRDQQVRFAPREKRMEQIDRCEDLLREIDPRRTYTYEYLCHRITDYRPDSFPNSRIEGNIAAHDLRLFVEDLSESAEVPAESVGQRVLTMDELSCILNVSVKTISRWRQQGLVGRRFMFDGRARVGFLQSSIDQFIARHAERVRRGTQFSQLSEEERCDIINRARRLATTGAKPSQVAFRIAKALGRSAETIRYTLKKFDEAHPAMALFPRVSGPINDDIKEQIYQQFRVGLTVDSLASKYHRTRGSIYRIVNEMRLRALWEYSLDFVPSPEFTLPTADQEILKGASASAEVASLKKPRVPAGLPSYLASLYEVPLLSKEQEQVLFRRLNYLKFKASKMRETMNPAHAKSSTLDQIEYLHQRIVATKNEIVRANLRLVVSIAKRHVGHNDNFFELVSDGNVSLIRAVEKFDYTRGNKFSTYATWAIMKNFARTIPDEIKYQDRFRTTQGDVFLLREEPRPDPLGIEFEQSQRESQIGRMLNRLDEREQKIIISRFGLDHHHEPLTLKEVGAEMGVTKERVRQIETRALEKLRLAAQEEKVDFPLG